MGVAEAIPGISASTAALLSGIYQEVLNQALPAELDDVIVNLNRVRNQLNGNFGYGRVNRPGQDLARTRQAGMPAARSNLP